ncbi:MAG: DUF922 domain-containing protein, partial [Actinobacteria bacterium]
MRRTCWATRLLFLLIVFAVFLGGTQQALARTRATRSYEVTGTTTEEIQESIEREAPKAGVTGGYSGMVESQWRAPYGITGSAEPAGDGTWKATAAPTVCTFSASVSTTMVLPAYTPPPGADQAVVDEWNRYLEALREHEEGHEAKYDAFEERLNALKGQVEGLSGTGTGATAQEAAAAANKDLTDKVNSLIEEAKKKADELNEEYDAATDHGGKQGAVLDFEGDPENFDELIQKIQKELRESKLGHFDKDDDSDESRLDFNGDCTVDVPDESLPQDLSLSLSRTELHPPAPAGMRFCSSVYRLGPTGLNFVAPIDLTLKFDCTNDRVDVFYNTPGSSEWVKVPRVEGSGISGSKLKVKVTHFTNFAVICPTTYDESPPAYGRSAWRYKDLHDSSPKYEGAYAQF